MSSEGGSSKSATIEMYAPSSYNETVNGETLSSISEKSESYSQNGSNSDYAVSWFNLLKVTTWSNIMKTKSKKKLIIIKLAFFKDNVNNWIFSITFPAGRCDQSCCQHLSYRSNGRPSCLRIVPRGGTSESGPRHSDAPAEVRQLWYGWRQLHWHSASQCIHSTR